MAAISVGMTAVSIADSRRAGSISDSIAWRRLQDLVGNVRQPVEPAILILGPKGGQNQLGEQLEAANVLVGERPCGS